MKLILENEHFTALIVTSVDILLTRDRNATTADFRLSFVAEKRAEIAYNIELATDVGGNPILDENGVQKRVYVPILDEDGKVTYTTANLTSPIVLDTVTRENLPYDLYTGLRKASTNAEILQVLNPMLQSFNSQFVNTLAGLDLNVKEVIF